MDTHNAVKALRILDESINLFPGNIDALEMKRRFLLSQKQYNEAARVCSDIESINPELGLRYKVEIYIQSKNIPKAFELADRYSIVHPDSARSYMMRALVYNSQGETDKAILEINNGIAVDENDVDALLMLGDLYAEQNNFKSAFDSYEDALKKQSDSVPALIAEGGLFEKMGKNRDAINRYREVLAISRKSFTAINNLAYIYVNDSANLNLSEGLRLAFMGFRIAPQNQSVMDTLGFALLKNGRNADAQKILEKASALLPGNPTVVFHLALAQKANGQKKSALASLQKTLSFGTFPEADRARALLHKMEN
jgi:tetratricopeptide (TPR) repeat protein